jgi:hypothetical protein
VETDIQIAEEGWWFGRYDKEDVPFQNNQTVTA